MVLINAYCTARVLGADNNLWYSHDLSRMTNCSIEMMNWFYWYFNTQRKYFSNRLISYLFSYRHLHIKLKLAYHNMSHFLLGKTRFYRNLTLSHGFRENQRLLWCWSNKASFHKTQIHHALSQASEWIWLRAICILR